jgi:PST family polysaccharide transporter
MTLPLVVRSFIRAVRHPIAQNAAALYLVQVMLMVLPIVTLPWLARALGAAQLGVAVLAQSTSFLLAMLIEYGFGLSATREVARERHDARRLGRTVADVQGGKLLLALAVTALSIVLLPLIPAFREDLRLAVFSWGLALLQGLNSGWFFTGTEQMRLSASIEVVVRLMGAVAMVAFVRDPGDTLLLLWIFTATAAASSTALTVLMYRQVAFLRPTVAGARAALRAGRPLFVLTAATSLYTTATVFLLGIVVSSAQLALFASAERVVRAALRVTGMLGTATYPRVSLLLREGREDRAQRLSVLAFATMLVLSLAAAGVLLLTAPWIVRVFLGAEFAGATPVMRILTLLIPLVVVSATLSGQWLLPRGLDRAPTRVLIAAGLANIPATLAFGSALGIEAVAWSLVAIEVCVAVNMAILIRRAGVLPSAAQALGRPS